MKSLLLTVVSSGLTMAVMSAQQPQLTSVNLGLDKVASLSVNRSEDYMVVSAVGADGIEKASEIEKRGNLWGSPKPIDAINNVVSNATVGGLFLTDDCRKVYFHARTTAEGANYDIYYCTRTNGDWSTPIKADGLATAADELSPSVVPGERTIFFLRHQVVADERTERKEYDKQTIFRATKDSKGKWVKSEPVNSAVTYGFAQSVRIAQDGLSLYYSMRENKKAQAKPEFSRNSDGDAWLLPETMLADDKNDYFYPQITDAHLYVIVGEGKRMPYGKVCFTDIPATKYKPLETVVEKGSIRSFYTKKPIVADIQVFNPTSHVLLGSYSSSSDDGSFYVVNLAKKGYQIDVRADGYSYVSYLPDYSTVAKAQLPQTIELFDSISLGLSVFDSEIFRPINAKVIAVRQSDKAIFRSVKESDGRFVFKLPLGSNYNIISTAPNFQENKFLFKLEGDIVSHRFERELEMAPLKRDVKMNVFDVESNVAVAASILFENKSREEKILVKPSQQNVRLREGDEYTVSVNASRGYFFKMFDFDLKSHKDEVIEVGLVPLKIGAKIILDNILFESASAELRPESYIELDKLVGLLKQNPQIVVEISAHTDNIGSSSYNTSLSMQRAASVVEYLQDSGVSKEQLTSQGYGFSKPLVPNDSDENRQKNRRVEFYVVGHRNVAGTAKP